VDAAFLRRRQRDAFRALAVELQVPFVILDMEAESEVLRSRILDRAAHGTDASEATLAVLEAQMRDQEPLTDEERGDAIELHTGSMTAANVADLCDMLAKRVSR
jgi:predicted kinase